MNRIYRHIWSKAPGCAIVVPECVRGGGARKGGRRRRKLQLAIATLLIASGCFMSGTASAQVLIDGGAHEIVDGDGLGEGAPPSTRDTPWNTAADLSVGVSNAGELDIRNGGIVSSLQGKIGVTSTGNGTVTVTGADSTWTNTGWLYVGDEGVAELFLTDGGLVSAPHVRIAERDSAIGTLTIGAESGDAAAAAGTLNVGGVHFGAGVGQIVFNHTDSAYFFSSSISGAGSVLVENGTTVLGGINSYSGGTTISGGTLRGTTTSLQGDIANNAALIFYQVTDRTYAGNMSGTGTFTKRGTGNVTFSGNSAGFIGATTISDGTLTVSGTLGDNSGGANGSSLTVESGGTLSIGTSRHVNAASITNEAGGTINVSTDATLRGTGNTLNNSGVINVDDLGLITGAGDIRNLADGVINFAGNGQLASDNDGSEDSGIENTVNDGTININGANTYTVLIGDELVNQGSGRVNVNDGYLFVEDQVVNSSPGAEAGGIGGIDIGSAGKLETGRLFNNAGGEITNAGELYGDVENNAGGTITSTGLVSGGRFFQNRGTTNAEGAISYDIINRDAGVFNVTGDLDTFHGFDLRETALLNVTGGDLSVSGTLGHQSTAANGITIAAGRTLSADSVGIGDTFVNAVLLNNGTLTAANTITNIGTVQNNGTINGGVDNWRSLTNAGTLNDGLTINDGTVTNTGTVNGPIDVLGGTFITHAGGQASDINNQGSLVFNQAANGAYAGIISGSGTLTKQGTGALTLTQDSSAFAGTTTVFGGELVVNGALGGILNMNGGALGGSGSLGNVILESGARLTPGNSIGTMNVVNYTFNPGSIYEVELDDGGFIAGTNNDLLNATGTVTINGGTVHVTPENGTDDGSTYTPGTYTIITAATGVAGAGFDAVVTDDYAFLDFILDYSTANQVDLISALSVTPVTGFCVPGMSLNQCAAGNGAFSMGAGNSVYDAVLTLSNAEAPVALDQLSGEIHASARTALLEDSRFLREAAMDRLRVALGGTAANDSAQIEKRISEGFGLWGQGFGSWSRQGGNGNASGMDRSIGGFLMGGDALVWDNMRLGVLGGYSRSGFSTGNLLSTGTADTYTLGAYGGGKWDAFALSGGLAHSWHSLDMSRSVAFTGFSDNLSVAYSARTLQAWGEAAYSFEAGASRFEPFANLAYLTLSTNSFTETGGAAALTSASNVVDAAFATLGVRAETDVALGDMSARLHGMVGWRHAFGGAPTAQMTFASGGNAFTIVGAPLAQDSLVLNAGIDIDLTDNAALGIAYSGQFGSGVQDHSAKVSLNVRF
ncbi:autotransporter domain-containing protein [Pelagibacterium sediminicola]|uniref:autotransporter domain-containing protein n=1 Tax=Pelagibacterium sediminicola TaxID=2248761 RepID=UPI000E312586|nr:autotransporter domain-containing protein [Pelagibacterium sediminicola]